MSARRFAEWVDADLERTKRLKRSKYFILVDQAWFEMP